MEIINARYYSLDEDAVQYSDQSPVVPQGWLALSWVYILTWFSFSFVQKYFLVKRIIFSILFRASNHQIVGKKN